jgi:hypothetical protein
MTTENDGGPAFPFEHGHSPDACNVRESGMTLLDYFAGQAMSVLSHPAFDPRTPDAIARRCYDTAEAMIAERERRFKGTG